MSRDTFWRDPERLRAEVARYGSLRAAASANGCNAQTLNNWWRRHGFHAAEIVPAGHEVPHNELVDWLRGKLRTLKNETIESLADQADASPRRIREALTLLGEHGYRIGADERNEVRVERVVPAKENVHLGLLEGSELRIGLVSDTHIGSQECAQDVLDLAFDHFAKEGLTEVWHAGDVGAGRGIYNGQVSEIEHRTLDDQIDLLVQRFPRRDGITTRLIGGNHDLEGDAARVGLDIASAFAARRDDVDYLGPYSAWMECHGGSWVHLLHGKGGMSYAYSYKAQKLVNAYPSGRKPAVLICGHWHVRGSFAARGIEVVFPGCTEWRSRFMERLGLTPDVGFHVLELTFGDDGSLVRFLPRWFRVWEGRVIG